MGRETTNRRDRPNKLPAWEIETELTAQIYAGYLDVTVRYARES